MIIHNFNIARSRLPIRPFKADAPLLIDPDGILPGAVPSHGFEPIARQGPQRVERQRGVQDGKPPLSLLLEALERLDEVTLTKSLGLFVLVAEDHSLPI